MKYRIKAKDGPGRIGKLTINDKQILTPNIFFINTSRFKAPDFADIILTDKDTKTTKPVLKITDKKLLGELLEIDEKEYYFEDEKTGVIIIKYAFQLFERPKKFVDFVVNLRKKVGPEKTIFAPGIAAPSNLALLAYISLDLFDSSRAIIAARNNTMFFSDGEYKTNDLTELPCNCPVCTSKKNSSELTFEDILDHNY